MRIKCIFEDTDGNIVAEREICSHLMGSWWLGSIIVVAGRRFEIVKVIPVVLPTPSRDGQIFDASARRIILWPHLPSPLGEV